MAKYKERENNQRQNNRRRCFLLHRHAQLPARRECRSIGCTKCGKGDCQGHEESCPAQHPVSEGLDMVGFIQEKEGGREGEREKEKAI